MMARSAITHSGRFSETSADPVAALQPERAQAARQPRDLRRRLAPGDRPLGAVALRPQERLVALPPRLVEEHGGEVRASVFGDVSIGPLRSRERYGRIQVPALGVNLAEVYML